MPKRVILSALAIRLLPLPLVLGMLPRAQEAGFAADGVRYYLPLARALAAEGEYALEPGIPHAGRVPLYPLLLAALEQSGLGSDAGRATVQALLGAAALMLLWIWARRLFDERIANAAFLLAAVLPDFAVYSYVNMSENLTALLVMAMLASFGCALERDGLRWWAVAGTCLGLASLTREFSITLVMPLAAWLAWSGRTRPPAARLLIGLAAAGIVILPWSVRNYQTFGEIIPLSDKAGATAYIGTLMGEHNVADARRRDLIEVSSQEANYRRLQDELAQARGPGERERAFWRAAGRNVIEDPRGQARHVVRKAAYFWSANVGWRHARRLGRPLALGLAEGLYWVCILAAAGAAFTRRGRDRNALLAWLLIGWTFAFHVLLGTAEPRYHFLALPPLCVLAAVSLTAAAGAIRRMRRV